MAGVLTTALGEAYIQIMAMVFTGEMSQEDFENEAGKEKMNEIYREELKKRHVPFVQ